MKNLSLLFLVLLFSCGRKHEDDQNSLNKEYLEKEIASRTIILAKDSSLSNEITLIQKEVDNLSFLTVDIENINACLIKSNRYFVSAATKYGVDTSGFVVLYKGVPLYDVKNIIRKNHLSLLNKLLIKRSPADSLMLTAQ